jgi:hypothetical protein
MLKPTFGKYGDPLPRAVPGPRRITPWSGKAEPLPWEDLSCPDITDGTDRVGVPRPPVSAAEAGPNACGNAISITTENTFER